jgi:hypothetical protein
MKTGPDRASAGEGGRLDTGQVVDMGGEPVGDRRDMAPDLVELDDTQCLVGPVVLEQRLETRWMFDDVVTRRRCAADMRRRYVT